jgi:ABC-type uncharacterized transport system ATPase subunit
LIRRSTTAAVGTDDGAAWDLDLTGRDPRAFLSALAALPVQVERFERVEPTLHEIFLQHVGNDARRAARREAADA